MTAAASHHLVVMRHSKAEQAASNDRARRLTDRGRADATEASRWLAREGHLPALILASSATRALETAQIVAEAVGDPRIEVVDDLYRADAYDVVAVVKDGLDEEAPTAMVVGHNPTMEELATLLQPVGARAVHFPTSGLAVLDCGEGRWATLQPGQASVVAAYNPRG